MITYLAHSPITSIEHVVLYKYENDVLILSETVKFEDLATHITGQSQLIFFLPSSNVSSYSFDGENGNNPEAVFISGIEDSIVEDVSNISVKTSATNGLVINKSLIDTLNKELSHIRADVYMYPEHLLFKGSKDTIVVNDSHVIFSHLDGTGTSIDKEYANDYLSILNESYSNYSPDIYSLNSTTDSLFKDIELKDISIFHRDFINNHDNNLNLFEFKYSFTSILSKSSFTKFQLGLLAACLLILFISPSIIISNTKSNTLLYKDATSDIFKSLSTKITRVVEPRSQIDALLGKGIEGGNEIKIPNIDFIYRLGGKFVSNIQINFVTSTAKISIDSMPSMQMSLISNMGESFGIEILEQDTSDLNGLVSGVITIKFSNA
ncbi:hypothetical protein OAT15_03110 [Gammaproteobacteria bacterium]|jgi:hypothetical protein|nr:hypothetical protein [Gammaproteobacteria bacterium]MDC1124022.1 hypothetical protein [Gammaproteobacteria bacterium]